MLCVCVGALSDRCCVFCLYCEAWSCRCSCMGSVSVSSCRCCRFVSCASCGSSGWVHSKCSGLQNAVEYRRIKN